MSFFSALFGDGGAKKAARAQQRGIAAGQTTAFGELDRGVAGATDQYGRALTRFEPYAATSTAANTSYSDALGLNGPEGTTRAQGQFRAGPGYDFAMDQGLQALERRASSRGQLGSGNLSADTLGFSQGLANQEYGGWLDRLAGARSEGIGMAGAQAGIDTGLGDRLLGVGTEKAQIGWNAATGKGNAEAEGILTGNKNIFDKVTGALTFGAGLIGAPMTGGTSLAARFGTMGRKGLF